MSGQEIYKELPKGILNWYDFRKDSKILYINVEKDAPFVYLYEKGMNVVNASPLYAISDDFLEMYMGYFDYVVMINQIERITNLKEYLLNLKKVLSKKGFLLIGMDNRLGLRYFCGDRDPFTNRNFDGIENYRKIYDRFGKHLDGRTYSKSEIENILDDSGFMYRKFYSVLPNINFPQLVYAEDVIPEEEFAMRFFPKYNFPDAVFLEEQFLYTDIIANGMFHQMSNGYFVECSLANVFCSVSSATLSMDRGKENALVTKIYENTVVEKKWLYDEGKHRIEKLYEHTNTLRDRGIKVVEVQLNSDGCSMDFCEGENALIMFSRLLIQDPIRFEELLDEFIQLVYQSSNYRVEDGEIILDKGYIDMVPLNCFYFNNEFIFFDQEFCIDNYPIKGILYRIIDIVCINDVGNESQLNKQYLWKKYGLYEDSKHWKEFTDKFIMTLRNTIELIPLVEKHSVNSHVLNTNRQKINYPLNEYKSRFTNIFDDIKDKDVLIFGTGVIASRFIAQFGKELNIIFMLDNNVNRWGETLEGIDIVSPNTLNEIDMKKSKIIICIKNYLPIIWQLDSMGIKNYSVYDRNIEYPRISVERVEPKCENTEEDKAYNKGYIAGVFDLFHIGHLNLIKRAKEQCKYLIVGVVTDEGVRKFKKTEPYIPLEERMELLRSCKYVDEVVEIPLYLSGMRDAYNMYQFDCVFSGSDYENNPIWLSDREYLRKRGSEMIFLSYTEKTSSSKIKSMIDKSLV